MKPMRLIISIVGIVVIVIIFGGISALMLYLSGDTGILRSFWTGITGAFAFSWIFGLAFVIILGVLLYGLYSGLRSGSHNGR